MGFSDKLKAAREKAGLTVYALWQKSGVDKAFLYQLEKGTKSPSWEVVCKIAAALGVSTEVFRDKPSRKGKPK